MINYEIPDGLYIQDHFFFMLAIVSKTYFQKIADDNATTAWSAIQLTILQRSFCQPCSVCSGSSLQQLCSWSTQACRRSSWYCHSTFLCVRLP